VTFRRRPLRTQMVILWDKQRPRPRYVTAYCEMLAEHVREIFPITRPSDSKGYAEQAHDGA
jgi:hypothetical protein